MCLSHAWSHRRGVHMPRNRVGEAARCGLRACTAEDARAADSDDEVALYLDTKSAGSVTSAVVTGVAHPCAGRPRLCRVASDVQDARPLEGVTEAITAQLR